MTLSLARLANDVVAFLVEMAMLGLMAMGGFRIFDASPAVQWGVALAIPAVAIAIWAARLAPKAKDRFKQPALAGVKILLFLVAAYVGSYWNGGYAVYFLVIGILNAVLEYALDKQSVGPFVV